jgi:nucleotide-binding universal stress UspA family protein
MEVAMRSDGAIMVGVAGGSLDRIVLSWAAEDAVSRNADLLVCHVREQREPSPPHTGELESAGWAELLVREAANAACTWFPDLAVTTAVGHDRVASALIRASLDARIVVVGAGRDDGVAGPRLGSLAEQVALNARCPVAVVRPPSAPDLADVVVGVDGSSHSYATLRFAVAEARRFGGRLIVVHAYRLPAPAEYGPNAGVDEPRHRAAAEELVERALDRLGPDRDALKIETKAVHGGAAAALLDAASSAAVLVVGARGLGGFERLRIGSVSQHVLRNAPCSVAITR